MENHLGYIVKVCGCFASVLVGEYSPVIVLNYKMVSILSSVYAYRYGDYVNML